MHINSQQCMNYHCHWDCKVEFINWVGTNLKDNRKVQIYSDQIIRYEATPYVRVDYVCEISISLYFLVLFWCEDFNAGLPSLTLSTFENNSPFLVAILISSPFSEQYTFTAHNSAFKDNY